VIAGRLEPFFHDLRPTRLAPYLPVLRRLTRERLAPGVHGDLRGWERALAALPQLPARAVRLDRGCVGVEAREPLDDRARQGLERLLGRFHPWRKGPFCLHGVQIDAEWRSDWKWRRLADAIAPLQGRLVLDCGCGNGYYAFRALGAGAGRVVGVDPTLRFVAHLLAVNHFVGERRLGVLPLADTDLPDRLGGLDTVFSMGVLYHRRDPALHLAVLRRLLRPGGELILETLVLDEPGRRVLKPEGRYARMRNVYGIPTPGALRDWLDAAGLRRVRIIDLTPTTVDEQRTTRWMRFQSLADFLDPGDRGRTVEGYPAPVRALALAER
jgi:tRNA (mo5U34)-methyltransferase